MDDARRKIESGDPANPAALADLDALRFTAAGSEAARLVLASGGSPMAMWTAIWIYASSGSDPAPLSPALAHADPSIRVLAAAVATSLGDPAGLTALEAALSNSERLLGSRPPAAIGDFAAFTLSRYVVRGDAPAEPETPDDLAALRGDWRAWLGTHRGQLTFDTASRTWRVP